MLSRRTQNAFWRLQVAVSAAELDAALGRLSRAKKGLESVLSEAKQTAFYAVQLEARLGLGQIEMKLGAEGVGRVHLEALEAEARAKGYGLIVRKAAAALGTKPGSSPAVGGP